MGGLYQFKFLIPDFLGDKR